jgi:hypothetical protein
MTISSFVSRELGSMWNREKAELREGHTSLESSESSSFSAERHPTPIMHHDATQIQASFGMFA